MRILFSLNVEPSCAVRRLDDAGRRFTNAAIVERTIWARPVMMPMRPPEMLRDCRNVVKLSTMALNAASILASAPVGGGCTDWYSLMAAVSAANPASISETIDWIAGEMTMPFEVRMVRMELSAASPTGIHDKMSENTLQPESRSEVPVVAKSRVKVAMRWVKVRRFMLWISFVSETTALVCNWQP